MIQLDGSGWSTSTSTSTFTVKVQNQKRQIQQGSQTFVVKNNGRVPSDRMHCDVIKRPWTITWPPVQITMNRIVTSSISIGWRQIPCTAHICVTTTWSAKKNIGCIFLATQVLPLLGMVTVAYPLFAVFTSNFVEQAIGTWSILIQLMDCSLAAPSLYLNQYWLIAWWRHQMETFSPLLALCAWNSPVTGEFPSQRPATRSFGVFFHLRLNKTLE